MADADLLGRALLDALRNTNLLIAKVPEGALPKLEAQRDLLLAQLGRLVDVNLDRESAQYQAATARLQTASAGIRQALADMSKVAQAIEMLGQALELAASLRP
jgi:hypothetical protein